MIHETAIIGRNVSIGGNTFIWAFTHICEGAIIGNNCSIGEGVHIGKGVLIQDGTRIQNHALIYEGVSIGKDCFIGAGVVTTNDLMPKYPFDEWKDRFKETIIRDRVSIGSNSTILCGITLEEGCVVGAGSVVTKTVKKDTIVYGNPAKFKKQL